MPKLLGVARTVSLTHRKETTRCPHVEKKKMDPYLTPYTKMNLELVKDLNVGANTTKLLEESMGAARICRRILRFDAKITSNKREK